MSPSWGSRWRQIDWPTVSRSMTLSLTLTLLARASSIYKRQARPLFWEGAQRKQDCNCQTIINIWSWAPDGTRHQDLLTDHQSQCDFDFDCTDRRLVCSAKGRIFNNMLYVRNVHLTKGQAYSWATNPSSRQRGCYIRTITARVLLKKISGRGSHGAWRQYELIGVNRQSYSSFDFDFD
jgi:hypothetical protein